MYARSKLEDLIKDISREVVNTVWTPAITSAMLIVGVCKIGVYVPLRYKKLEKNPQSYGVQNLEDTMQ